jgi:hypothetical protein
LLERLAEIDHARGRYQAMTAEGLMTFDELEARLDELGASRRVTQRELRAARDRQEEVERLERERDALLEVCAGGSAAGRSPRALLDAAARGLRWPGWGPPCERHPRHDDSRNLRAVMHLAGCADYPGPSGRWPSAGPSP